MSGKCRGYKPRPLFWYVHDWLVKQSPEKSVPPLDQWFWSHLRQFPIFSEKLQRLHAHGLATSKGKVAGQLFLSRTFALTSSGGPVVRELLQHLEQLSETARTTLAAPEGRSVHVKLLLYGLLINFQARVQMLVWIANGFGTMGTIHYSKVANCQKFIMEDSDSTISVEDQVFGAIGFLHVAGTRVIWPACVKEVLRERAKKEKQSRLDALAADAGDSGSDESMDEEEEDEGETDDEDERAAGPRRPRVAGTGLRRPRVAGGAGPRPPRVAGASNQAKSVMEEDGAPPAELTALQKALAAYYNLTKEQQLLFRHQAKLVPIAAVSQLSKLGKGYTELLQELLEDIRHELLEFRMFPFADRENPPDWFMKMRVKRMVPKLLGHWEGTLIESLADGWLYWNFFRRVLYYIKHSKPFDPSGKLRKSVDRARVIYEVLVDMPVVFFFKTYGVSYVASGGLFYVQDKAFIPFEQTKYFNGDKIQKVVKDCYTDTLARLLEQRWPLSLARHLAFRKVSKLPEFIEEASAYVQRSGHLIAHADKHITDGMSAYFQDKFTSKGQSMPAFKFIQGLRMYYLVPPHEPCPSFSTDEEDDPAAPN